MSLHVDDAPVQGVAAPSSAVDALLAGLIDYAGLFPPAGEDMRTALESYSSYLRGHDRRAFGRFIVPLARLGELEDTGRDLLRRGKGRERWRLSVLVTEDVRDAGEEMLRFNQRHGPASPEGHAVIDVAELKASTVDELERQRSELPPFFTPYFELPLKGDLSPLLKALSQGGARAKIRVGGVTPDAFPPAREIVDFIIACHRESVAFKATAGLHHPLRGLYRLNYEPDSPSAAMYGFLNIFLAAALVHAGESAETALAALEETNASAFTFTDAAVAWRDKLIGLGQIRASRSELAISFGSCSFREPVDELARVLAAPRPGRR